MLYGWIQYESVTSERSQRRRILLLQDSSEHLRGELHINQVLLITSTLQWWKPTTCIGTRCIQRHKESYLRAVADVFSPLKTHQRCWISERWISHRWGDALLVTLYTLCSSIKHLWWSQCTPLRWKAEFFKVVSWQSSVFIYFSILIVFRYMFFAFTTRSVLAIRRTWLWWSSPLRCSVALISP